MTKKPVKAGALRLVLLGAVTSLVLAGCGNDTTPDDGSTPSAGASTSPGADDGSSSGTGDGTGNGKAGGRGSGTSSGSPGASPSTPGSTDGSSTDATDPTDSSTGTTGDGSGAGLEMPEAPEETVDSLSELLEPVGSAPLVSTPLPRAAQAQGRLVARFPTVLRPVRSSRVESSAISPSAGRLQVSLVASSALSPEQLLVAYRARLAARGLVELSTPVTDPGSVAAAFRRGRSTVTITATGAGARTSYVVHATLHTGGE
ncbi:hypothetical protein EUA93_11465 [Nocardioides oleivorans]|uniref:Uncharacterized protein n=1 Tax=Nocardioides oleivorans TaxID=273676 RepID=A0A4V1RL86_9ACTN|nr:hypothetical protein [Nocardioides oleivorans]RYB94912.1 hypothetical protein EUA93_11465 [Nocardioides oleivorans]